MNLDALHPSDLENMIRASIEAELDMNHFHAQELQEHEDARVVGALRNEVLEVVQSKLAEMFD